MIAGVPTSTAFAPKTKCEIRDVQWFPVDSLPLSKKEGMPDNKLNIGTNNLFMVMPFTK
jgi:mRNA-decapping enzyme subunit 2